jgi:hypothetical protein
MESKDMGLEASAGAGIAAVKAMGLKAALGMAGAAILYLFMPPARPDGTFSRKEFAARLAVAGFFSLVAGDWAVDVVEGLAPWLMASKHPAPFWLASGAPGWWVSRAAALWIYQRRDKNLAELGRDAVAAVKEVGNG